MNKAGIMEIGDVFVVNMADRPEARRCIRDLKQALMIGRTRATMPPVCATMAVEGAGVPELWDAIEAHGRALTESGELAAQRRSHARAEFREILERHWLPVLHAALRDSPRFDEVMAELDECRKTPAMAARTLLDEIQVARTHQL